MDANPAPNDPNDTNDDNPINDINPLEPIKQGKGLSDNEIANLLNGETPDSFADPYVLSLQKEVERLELDKLALQQEKISGILTEENDDAVAGKAAFKKSVPAAIVGIIILAESAESESVRLNANKYIIACGLGDELSGQASSDDEFKNMLKKFAAKPQEAGS